MIISMFWRVIHPGIQDHPRDEAKPPEPSTGARLVGHHKPMCKRPELKQPWAYSRAGGDPMMPYIWSWGFLASLSESLGKTTFMIYDIWYIMIYVYVWWFVQIHPWSPMSALKIATSASSPSSWSKKRARVGPGRRQTPRWLETWKKKAVLWKNMSENHL